MTVTAAASTRRPIGAPILAGTVVVGGCVALGAIDPTGGPVLCPFRALTGLDCPGCGATRALHHLFNGRVLTALDLNVLVVLATPFILWGLFAGLTRLLGGPRWRSFDPPLRVTWALVVVLVTFWVVRNLPWAPFSALGSGP